MLNFSNFFSKLYWFITLFPKVWHFSRQFRGFFTARSWATESFFVRCSKRKSIRFTLSNCRARETWDDFTNRPTFPSPSRFESSAIFFRIISRGHDFCGFTHANSQIAHPFIIEEINVDLAVLDFGARLVEFLLPSSR